MAAKGEQHGSAILTDAAVRAIREDHSRGIGLRPLARRYRVNRATIQRVVQQKTWRHVK